MKQLAWIAALGALTACQSLFFGGFHEASSQRADAGNGGAGGAAGGVSGTGGGGGASDGGLGSDATAPCKTAANCPGADTECRKRQCINGACSTYDVPSGANCKQGGILCDGKGACVECRVNGVKDVEETDVDCGGGHCPPCVAGQTCKTNADCVSKNCGVDPSGSGKTVCLDAQCNDGITNGQETDTDCGGPSCPSCARGKACKVAADCSSGFCSGGTCCGVACDGTCESCANPDGACKAVPAGTDPGDAFCPGVSNACTASGLCSSCSNKQRDTGPGLDESDVDCGGPLCPRCADGKLCNSGSDCQSCICENGKCHAPLCNDGKKDGCEADVDCGSVCNAPCGAGSSCKSKADCASGSCVNGVCGVGR